MKYPKITALVPEGEHFDEAVATVNEGIYLTASHFEGIEAALATADQAIADANTERQTALDALTVAQAELESAQANVTASAEALATANARIAELEGAAGSFSETGKSGEEKPAGEAEHFVHPVTAEANRLRALQGLPPIGQKA